MKYEKGASYQRRGGDLEWIRKLNNKIDGGATKHFKLQRHEYIQSIVDQVMHSNTWIEMSRAINSQNRRPIWIEMTVGISSQPSGEITFTCLFMMKKINNTTSHRLI